MKKIYTTKCPKCKMKIELKQTIKKLMKSDKKELGRLSCDNCAYSRTIIIDGKYIFYKNSEIEIEENCDESRD